MPMHGRFLIITAQSVTWVDMRIMTMIVIGNDLIHDPLV